MVAQPALQGAFLKSSLSGNEQIEIFPTSPRTTKTTTGAIAAITLAAGTAYYVDPVNGSDENNGSVGEPFATIQAAIDVLTPGAGDVVYIAPGDYDEALVIERPTTNDGSMRATLIGNGPKGAIAVATSTADASGLVNDADDVTLINVGLGADGTGSAILNTGSRLRLYGCKLEGGAFSATMTLGTVVQEAAGTKGNGADCLLQNCEHAWSADGLQIMCSDFGAVTELQVVGNWFHDVDGQHVLETIGSGGSAGVMFASLLLSGNIHANNESGVAPSEYIALNGDNANSGILTGSYFPAAIDDTLVLLSTALICVGCYFTGGISNAQPS